MSSLIKGPLVGAGLTADVEHDGDRGPRAFRDPLSVLDQAASAVLGAVRAIEPLIGAARTARRGRDEVLRDEAARRAGGGE